MIARRLRANKHSCCGPPVASKSPKVWEFIDIVYSRYRIIPNQTYLFVATMGSHASYSTLLESKSTFKKLINNESLPLTPQIRALASAIQIHGKEDWPVIPTLWRETEAITALKSLEAAVAIALGKIRYGIEQTAEIDMDHATIFLFMSYLSTVDGFGKWDPRSVERLKREVQLVFVVYGCSNCF